MNTLIKISPLAYLSFFILVFSLASHSLTAQENYEIQVYGSPTVPYKSTAIELHSNFIFDGERSTVNNMYPTNHMLHETIEITHGFTGWFETGFYIYTAAGNEGRTGYVGSHIRPRITVPENWGWPLGVSLSVEIGFQDLHYAEDDWSVEIRPIFDKNFGKLYISLNPVLEKSLHGMNSNKGLFFSPNVKIAYDLFKKFSMGIEYYGATGLVNHFDPVQSQEHQLFLVTDLITTSRWEFNGGYGIALTEEGDNAIFKTIIGYRIN